MKNRTLRRVSLAAVAVGLLGAMAVSLPAQHAGHDAVMLKEKPPAGHKWAKQAEDLAAALKAIDATAKLVEQGKKDLALAKLKHARHLVAKSHKALTTHGGSKFANLRCPIMGSPLKADKVTADLTRMFKGRKVGLCCAHCPAAWDKLSDADKAKKLHAAMAPKPAKDTSETHH